MKLEIYCVLFLLALLSVSGYAQDDDRNTVLYVASRDTGVKNFWRGSWVHTTTLREAQLRFTNESLLFVSHEKTDTIAFAKINQVYHDLYYKRTFTFRFDKKKGLIALRFCKRNSAKAFINMLIEKKVNYKQPKLIAQIAFAPFVPFIGDTALPGIDTNYEWRRNCK
ncbi:MAG: hypothetical protein ORN54_08680 [Cyclobacteriaceae bacterium]|nr:hypothetical protein [Cyclobacteriaceae bacterium]